MRSKQTLIGYGNEAIIQISFEYDFFSSLNEKHQYTMLELFSEIGGLFNSFHLIGKACCTIFVTNSYMSYIAGSVYFVKKASNKRKRLSADQEEENVGRTSLAKEAVSEIESKERFSMNMGDGVKYFCCCLGFKKKKNREGTEFSNAANF
eukprot:CAMPEP_0170553634 /NCGR_PEP_ID=MMETSP0211-20121228/11478_1 /TAXON_ID=311385 /ORGANISM="Pseudokeronopsis sp., Strain OXSARD2" /LENGTH=149 /DNA_ID=CAMNT_0010862109 /DNA_START=734 /DNA_END=1183 /DNA_ORIENTATION=-